MPCVTATLLLERCALAKQNSSTTSFFDDPAQGVGTARLVAGFGSPARAHPACDFAAARVGGGDARQCRRGQYLDRRRYLARRPARRASRRAARDHRRRYGRVIVRGLVLCGLAWIAWQLVALRPSRNGNAAPDDARAPQDVRIRVEVLNATQTRGLARRATFYLRDRGFDVVGSGNVVE